LKSATSPLSQQVSYQIQDRLYLSITDRCTLECTFCPKIRDVYKVKGYDLRMQHRPDVAEIIASIGDPTRYSEVVFCGYGEPTLRLKVLLEVARYVKSKGGRVRVVTDGLANLVHDHNVLVDMVGLVDALSVSLNAQNAAVYEHNCRPNLPGSFDAMLQFLCQAPRFVPDVTATAIEGLEGVDIEACKRLARHCGVKFRTRELCEESP
jgi:TatD family-associated radical SAM protein